MKFFILFIALSTTVSGFNFYVNQNFKYHPPLVQYENQNFYNQGNQYHSKNNNPIQVEVLNYDNLGPVSCPNIKQPLCAFNGQQFKYFENPCQLEIKNFEELIQGKQG